MSPTTIGQPTRITLALSLLLATGGCRKERPPPPPPDARPPARKLEVEWRETKFFPTELTSSWNGEVRISDGGYHVVLYGFPEGSRWEVTGGKPTGGTIKDPLSSDVEAARLAELPLAPLAGAALDKVGETVLDPRRTLVVTLPTGDHVHVTLPPLPLGNGFPELLASVAQGPLLFGEPAAATASAGPASIVFVGVSPSSVDLAGDAKTAGDIDAIALGTQPGPVRSTKECTGYTDPGRSGDPSRSLTLELKDTEVTVHDRRTGKVLARKTFGPFDACPSLAVFKAGMNRADSAPPTGEILIWLRTLLRKP